MSIDTKTGSTTKSKSNLYQNTDQHSPESKRGYFESCEESKIRTLNGRQAFRIKDKKKNMKKPYDRHTKKKPQEIKLVF